MCTGSTLIMQKQNRIVLFDIDHTIFDTESYIQNLYKKLSDELGYEDLEEFKKIANALYANIRSRTKFLPPDFFLEEILKKAKNPTNIKKLNTLFWNKDLFESSIYPDVDDAFGYLTKNKFAIGIFSTGDHSHQSVKIESLINHLSKEHIYISEDKFKIIKTTLPSYKDYRAYLLDDLPEILHEAKEHNKNIFTVLIKRESNKRTRPYPDNFKPDAVIGNLDEFIDIIRSQN